MSDVQVEAVRVGSCFMPKVGTNGCEALRPEPLVRRKAERSEGRLNWQRALSTPQGRTGRGPGNTQVSRSEWSRERFVRLQLRPKNQLATSPNRNCCPSARSTQKLRWLRGKTRCFSAKCRRGAGTWGPWSRIKPNYNRRRAGMTRKPRYARSRAMLECKSPAASEWSSGGAGTAICTAPQRIAFPGSVGRDTTTHRWMSKRRLNA